jgi:hypothetical protein
MLAVANFAMSEMANARGKDWYTYLWEESEEEGGQ